MQVFAIVFVIALSTALLAAVIVALDFDLAVIRAWRELAASQGMAGASTDWTNERQPEWTSTPWTTVPAYTPAVSPAPVAGCGRSGADTEAERWLAAATANRLSEYRAGEIIDDEAATPLRRALDERWPPATSDLLGVAAGLPSTPLRELLSQRRAENYQDEAAVA